ncbi:rhamnulokinase [Arthrobacter castelli]|uniref:rhamnulokinase n=1 Tax=Arthrobacter castelli TaxID=271431 RepID=UPI0004209160|nr:rhamnulokinase family protein [Arthrobacter castelli]
MKPARPKAYAAIDIGASSGRVMLGRLQAGSPHLETVHRFDNAPLELDSGLHWDIDGLFRQIVHGLGCIADQAERDGLQVVSIGIDTWAVDYGLVDDDGGLIGTPFSYRDGRTAEAVNRVHDKLPFKSLYETTGLQFLPFNTIYQLASEGSLRGVQALLIPDLIGFKLTGRRVCEATNASTTGLLNASSGIFDPQLLSAVDLPEGIFPPLIQPGETVGHLLPQVLEQTGLPESTRVVAVGSHDTASAVAAVPASSSNFAYISSGTWSLVGLELPRPVLSDAGLAANFTNERGIEGTIRYLRNCGGLWLLQECLRTWGPSGRLEDLLTMAAALPSGGPVIDADDDSFIHPGSMPERIQAAAAPSPLLSKAAVVRCIMDSLARLYARTLRQAAELADRSIDVVHIVGGGSQNELLCQLTANSTGLPVVAGPVEATAYGNMLLQARAAGELSADDGMKGIRAAARQAASTKRFEPTRPFAEAYQPVP